MVDQSHVAPPTVPGELSKPEGSWPTVVGVLGVVFGVLAVLSAVASALTVLLPNLMRGMPGMTPEVSAVIEKWTPFVLIDSALLFVLAVAQIVGSIGLIGRRRFARPLLVGWASVKILAIAGDAIVQYMMQTEQFAAQAGGGGPPLPAGMMEAAAVFSVVFYLVLGWAFPIFVLIWFWRATIRAQVSRWS